jgi:membrane protein implicated in regulation of membrane protease activity
MARLIPVAGIVLLILTVVLAVWLMRSVDRRDARARRRIARQESLADYQQAKAIEGLELQRGRLERGLDELHDGQRKTTGEQDR